jgi:hypothetical protein
MRYFIYILKVAYSSVTKFRTVSNILLMREQRQVHKYWYIDINFQNSSKYLLRYLLPVVRFLQCNFANMNTRNFETRISVTDHSYCDDVYYVCTVLWWCLLSAITYPFSPSPVTSFWWPRIRDRWPAYPWYNSTPIPILWWCLLPVMMFTLLCTCCTAMLYRAVPCCTVLSLCNRKTVRSVALCLMPGPRSWTPTLALTAASLTGHRGIFTLPSLLP